MSTTCSALISLSLYTLRSPSPDKRAVPIVFRKYVLTLRIVENDLSAVAVETGIPRSSMKHFLMLGYSCSLAKAKLSSSVSAGSGRSMASAALVHQVRHFAHSLRNVASSTVRQDLNPAYISLQLSSGRFDLCTCKLKPKPVQ
ncbi:hypothetical protein DPMN_176897 [Dreissena polymorpha]|uniref:Uncharacterized protein n=1 Tax=Dreissena polymorpha TaxID=45954 RepID=A0A9D4E7R8_DREPO|nr:hypothetical protein DPMN_176897 [Dreissena polymorpha]